MLCSINATAKRGVCPEMKTNIQTAVSMSTMRGLTKVLAAIGDPIGRLETAPDLAEFSAGLREKTVQKSRIGVLISADYEICAEVLKSPNWRTRRHILRFNPRERW